MPRSAGGQGYGNPRTRSGSDGGFGRTDRHDSTDPDERDRHSCPTGLSGGATILGIKHVVDLIHDDQKVECPDRSPRLDAFGRDDVGEPIQHGVAIGDERSSGTEDGVGFVDRRALDLPVEISLSRVAEVRPEGSDAADRVGELTVCHDGQRNAGAPPVKD